MLKARHSNEFGGKPIDNTLNVLVVDNNTLLINLLEKSLIQDSVNISAVTNIDDAIQLLKEKIFDAVLCDGPIDNYSKETILEIFEQNNFLRDQRIVLFSGFTQPDFIEKWKRKGLYSHIKKPTSRKKILEFLQATKNDPNLKKVNSQTIHEQIKEEATPEQLAKVEELTKQIEELESQSTKPTPSIESTHKAEIDLESAEQTIEDETEEEATPEQLAKVEELTKQIEELESQSTKPTPSIESTHKAEIDLESAEQTTFETQSNSEFKNILSKLASIKNQFLYNTSDTSDIGHTQIIEELFNLKKEIGKIRRKVYRSHTKQKRSKSTSTQNKKTKKQHLSKKKHK